MKYRSSLMCGLKRALAVFISVAFLIVFPVVANAYNESLERIYSLDLCSFMYRTSSLNSNARTAFSNAVADWNSAVSFLNFRVVTNSSNEVYSVYIVGDASRGETLFMNALTLTPLKYQNFDCYINTAYSYGTNNYRSTANHEFGHVLGLGHTTGTAIMNGNRNRETVYTPKTDDKNGVIAIWGS